MRWLYALGVRSWWVWLFTLICYAIFDYATVKQQADEERLTILQTEKIHELTLLQEQHQNLLEQLESQGDPAWTELTLMRKLGVVPEGQTKVVFK